MSNYFDNQDNWHWNISDQEVLVTTDHGDHTHTLNVTNVPIGEMADHTGQVMGDAHRAASHDFKESAEMENVETENTEAENANVENTNVENTDVEANTAEDNVTETAETVPSAEDGIEDGEDCEDGLDI